MAKRKKVERKTKAKRKKAPVTKATIRRKTTTVRKKPAKKALGPARITQDSQADRERRGQTGLGQSAATACSSHTNA